MEQKRERGSPLLLLDEGLQASFMKAISAGATYKLACNYAGICYVTLRNWINKAEKLLSLDDDALSDKDKIFVDFYFRLKKVEGEAALKWLEKIDNASEIQWQAAAWKLERRFPYDYGKDDRNKESEKEDSSIDEAKSIAAGLSSE
jgi:transposase